MAGFSSEWKLKYLFRKKSSLRVLSFSLHSSFPLSLSRSFCSVYSNPLEWSTNFAMLLFSAEYTITFQIYFGETDSITITIYQFLANGFWGILYASKIHMMSSTTQLGGRGLHSESEYYIWCIPLCAMQPQTHCCFESTVAEVKSTVSVSEYYIWCDATANTHCVQWTAHMITFQIYFWEAD